ncbi:hypothetical protein BKCO1_6100054 [Neofusicoccum parvum]|nr:hypothetical protein BKCO1_6100054 [Neofusicoccum parvum]
MVFHQNTLLSYFPSVHSPISPPAHPPQLPHSSLDVNMSRSPPAPDTKPRACSVHSVSTQGGDEAGRRMRKGSRAKHSWEYVPVDPAEDEVPPANASRLERELFSSFTNNFLTGATQRLFHCYQQHRRVARELTCPAISAEWLPSSAWTSRAPDGQAKESGKPKSSVFDDATNKTKASKKTEAKPSPVPDPFETRKRKSSPAAEKMAPKVKRPKTTGAATEAPKAAKAAAMAKRDSLLHEDIYAQALPWTNHAQQTQQSHVSNSQQHQAHGKAHYRQQQQQQQQRSIYPPTRAQLAEQLEEITHRGIAGGPTNFSSLREYRAACAAEAAWQERDQEVVERMLDNPRVIEVLRRLRVLNAEIEAERRGSKGVGKGHGKGGRKRKVSDHLMDGD